MIHDKVYDTFWRRKRELFGIPALAVVTWLLVLTALAEGKESGALAFFAILCNGLDFDNPYAIWPAEEGLPTALARAERLSIRLWGVGIDEVALANAWELEGPSEHERSTRFFRALDAELGRAGLAAAEAHMPIAVCTALIAAILFFRIVTTERKPLPALPRLVICWCILESFTWASRHNVVEPFLVKYAGLPLHNHPIAYFAIAIALIALSTYLASRKDSLRFVDLPEHSPGRKP